MASKHNYASRMALKRENQLTAGLISDRFPEVSGITLHMTYLQKGANPVLMVRTVNILPASYAYLKMDCMIKGCEGGGFDLTSIVSEMVKARKTMKKGALSCCGRIDALDSDHASVEYEIVIEYGDPGKGEA
jgi:hypothetical protein